MHIAPRLARRTPFYYGWAVLFAAGSTQFARNAAASLTLAVFIYPLSQELGWSRTLIAGASAVGGLASSAVSPGIGWLVDRYGARLVLTISIVVLGLSTASLAWATVPVAFYVAYGTGRIIFSSPILIGTTVVVSRWFVRYRGRATGLLFLSHSAGMVLFPLIASLIIQSRGSHDAWIVLGLLVWAVALAPVYLLIAQRPEDVGLKPDGAVASRQSTSLASPEPRADDSWTLRSAMGTPALWLLATAGGLLFFIQAGTNLHQGAYFRDQGLSPTVAGLAITFNAIFTGAGSILWGWAIERLSARIVYAGVALLMAIVSGLFVTADTTAEAFLFASLFGLSLGGALVTPSVTLANYFGLRSLGAIRGATETFVSLGQALGVMLSGVIFDSTGSYHAAFLTFAAASAATVLMLLIVRPPRSRYSSPQPA